VEDDREYTPAERQAALKLGSLLSLDMEYALEAGREPTKEDFIAAIGHPDSDFISIDELIDLIAAARGWILALLAHIDPENPRRLLRSMLEVYYD
jgi:hypothetical protein